MGLIYLIVGFSGYVAIFEPEFAQTGRVSIEFLKVVAVGQLFAAIYFTIFIFKELKKASQNDRID